VVAVFVLYDAGREVGVAVQAERIRTFDKNLRAILNAAIAEIVDKTGAPWDELTVHYYHRRGGIGGRRLALVGASRAGATEAESQRYVRLNEGVVGVAFVRGEAVAVSWKDFADNATRQGRDAWQRRTHHDRYGLSWGQLRSSLKPESMIASPVFNSDDGNIRGCILISGAIKRPVLTGRPLRQILDEVATAIDRLGPPPRGWWNSHVR